MEPIDQLLIEFEEQERWRDLLGEVLAVLNRDGGHYQTKHGAGRAAIEGVRSHYQMLTTIDALQAENARLREQAEALKAAILDIDAHSTAMGEDGDGFITGGYIVTVGSLHRALGAVGHTARKCSHEARCPTCAQAEALAGALESVRDVVVDADGRFLAAQKDVDSILQTMTEGDVHQIWKVADAALRAYQEATQ